MSSCRAPQIIGCSGTAYDSPTFREFFPTVESCFWIVSGEALAPGMGAGGRVATGEGQRGYTSAAASAFPARSGSSLMSHAA
jgi:hypothetical protein